MTKNKFELTIVTAETAMVRARDDRQSLIASKTSTSTDICRRISRPVSTRVETRECPFKLFAKFFALAIGDRMRRLAIIALAGLVFLLPAPAFAQEKTEATLQEYGWKIIADAASGQISVSHEGLGLVMGKVTLNVRDDQGTHVLAGWSAKKSNPTRLLIRSSNPTTGWQFDVEPYLLKISSTAQGAVVTAELPASEDRILARLLDPQGAPVNWDGTTEVQGNYGGSITRNQIGRAHV